MKVLTALIAALLMTANALYAQDEDIEDFSFEQEPLREESSPYFAIAGGYTATFYNLGGNFNDLNALLSDQYELGSIDAPVFMNGVQGFTGLILIPNLRLGFFGLSGMKSVERDINIDGQNPSYTRKADYTIGLTGLTIDYGIVPFEHFAILPGLGFGWGNLNLEVYQAPSETDWTDLGTELTNDPDIWKQDIETGFWYLRPTINFEYALTNLVMFRLGASYSYSFGEDWQLNETAAVNNVPDNVNGSGLLIQFGLFLGLFNY